MHDATQLITIALTKKTLVDKRHLPEVITAGDPPSPKPRVAAFLRILQHTHTIKV